MSDLIFGYTWGQIEKSQQEGRLAEVLPLQAQMDQKEYAKKLVNDHWRYVERLLETHGEDANSIKLIKFHYISAGIHFFGHGVEWWEKERRRRKKLRKKLKKARNIIKKEAIKENNERNRG